MFPSVPIGTLDEFFVVLMQKCNVYIDDGYLAKISKHFGDGNYLKIDYFKLANNMSRDLRYWCKERYLYCAPPFQSNPPTQEESLRKSGYDRVMASLSKCPDFYVREGRLQNVDGQFHQKGVDTLLTMDLMNLAISNGKIRTAILLTCDTDFVPIIKKIRESGIKAILYYYSDFQRNSHFSMSDHLLSVVDEKILITENFLKKSLMRNNNWNGGEKLSS